MSALFNYLIKLGDDSHILSHRLSEWCGHGPILEEDIAMTNLALDLIGQATELYKYAGQVEGKGRSEDDIAYVRPEQEYKNVLLVEHPNVDFGVTMMRQFLFDSYRKLLFDRLIDSKDETIAAVADKALKETRYHLKHSSEWVIRLGDGTEESNKRVQDALDTLWKYTAEMFYTDEVEAELIASGVIPSLDGMEDEWNKNVRAVLNEATLTIPDNGWVQDGGRRGVHTEAMGYILADIQYMQRVYPGLEW